MMEDLTFKWEGDPDRPCGVAEFGLLTGQTLRIPFATFPEAHSAYIRLTTAFGWVRGDAHSRLLNQIARIEP